MFLSCITIYGQNSIVKTTDKSTDNYYEYITFLSEGEINGEQGDVALRLVITSSEIYKDIYIKKVSIGEEGSGKKIEWKRMIDRDNLIKIFKFSDEFSSVKFIRWAHLEFV